MAVKQLPEQGIRTSLILEHWGGLSLDREMSQQIQEL